MQKVRNIVVLGAGESGIGAALLANRLGMEVFVSDKGRIAPVYRSVLESEGIDFEEQQHSLDRLFAAEVIVKSPGIPNRLPLIRDLRESGKTVWGEIEFGRRYAGPCTVLAVTGSNGKTTTTGLLQHLLAGSGFNARMAGNVGYAFARMIAEDWSAGAQHDAGRIFVVEISSFQLEDIDAFRPDVALLLNITPDHLDRYEYQLEKYAAAKFRIAENQGPEDLFLYNADNPASVNHIVAHPVTGPKLVALQQPVLENGMLRVGRQLFDMQASALKGPHNAFNALFALTSACRLGADPLRLQAALNTFRPPAHRMEPVGEMEGVQYINDSKATNVDSVYYALSAMDRPVVWVAGGQDKGNDYTMLLPLVAEKVRAIVCLGIDNEPIKAAFDHLEKPLTEVHTAQAAVAAAAAYAQPGDVVLLSPACASFDLFQNFMARGDQFRQAVQEMITAQKTQKHVTG